MAYHLVLTKGPGILHFHIPLCLAHSWARKPLKVHSIDRERKWTHLVCARYLVDLLFLSTQITHICSGAQGCCPYHADRPRGRAKVYFQLKPMLYARYPADLCLVKVRTLPACYQNTHLTTMSHWAMALVWVKLVRISLAPIPNCCSAQFLVI